MHYIRTCIVITVLTAMRGFYNICDNEATSSQHRMAYWYSIGGVQAALFAQEDSLKSLDARHAAFAPLAAAAGGVARGAQGIVWGEVYCLLRSPQHDDPKTARPRRRLVRRHPRRARHGRASHRRPRTAGSIESTGSMWQAVITPEFSCVSGRGSLY